MLKSSGRESSKQIFFEVFKQVGRYCQKYTGEELRVNGHLAHAQALSAMAEASSPPADRSAAMCCLQFRLLCFVSDWWGFPLSLSLWTSLKKTLAALPSVFCRQETGFLQRGLCVRTPLGSTIPSWWWQCTLACKELTEALWKEETGFILFSLQSFPHLLDWGSLFLRLLWRVP